MLTFSLSVYIFHRVFKENTFFLFFDKQMDLFQQICLCLGPSAVVNRKNTITSHFTVSKGLIENQTGNCLIFTFFSFFLLQIFYGVFYPSYVSICKDLQKTVVFSLGSFLQVFTFTVQCICNLWWSESSPSEAIPKMEQLRGVASDAFTTHSSLILETYILHDKIQ